MNSILNNFFLISFCVLSFRSNGQALMVKDVNPGFSSSFCYDMINVNGTLFFVAKTPAEGFELWKTDGTLAGTSLVKDINPGPGDAQIYYMINYKDTLYFSAWDGVNGQELWKSDGTNAGTVLLKDINPGSGNSSPSYMTLFKGEIYFAASGGFGSDLWKSDGTSGGTIMVKNMGGNGFPEDLIDVNGELFFRADDGVNGKELWKSDGSSPGTIMVKDINPGSSGSIPSSPSPLTNINGTLYFWASHVSFGTELWKSDGTAAGTVMLKDIRPGAMSSLSSNLKAVASISNTVFFIANDGINGEELWITDGTTTGTILLKDIMPGAGGSGPGDFVRMNNLVYFTAYGAGWELWKSDGTVSGTTVVKNFSNISSPNTLAVINNTLYFAASDGPAGTEFWKSDGTGAGTSLIQDINPGTPNSFPQNFTYSNGNIYFNADDGTNGRELWKFDPLSTAIIDLTKTGSEITIVPNPNNGTFFINTSMNGNCMVEILDAQGKMIKQTTVTDHTKIDISKEASGVYSVIVKDGQGIQVKTKKIVKE